MNKENIVDHFYLYKDRKMVYINGNFYKGGFAISQNKVKAILDNLKVMEQFVDGRFDIKIEGLKKDERLKYEG
jgi:hypothetical protein